MKAIIVDDEALARNRLYILLSEIDDIAICGSFGTAVEALRYIEENPVDVVFLDISMPEMDGMGFANLLLERQCSSRVVFVTGYDEYAVEAFELEAVDYLLKPISRERLSKTIGRLASRSQFQSQRLYVFCFGGFRVSIHKDGDETIGWRSPKVEELFALLVCKGSISREEIVDTLWEDFPLDKAMKNLNSTVYYIRRTLQQHGLEDCMVTTRRQISLDRTKIICDLYEFERLQKTAWNTELEQEKLNELYQGELFQGKTYEWSFGKAQILENNMIFNLLQAAEKQEEQKQPEAAERLYMQALEMNPFHEAACDKLMSFYLRTGKNKKAKKLHREIEQLLAEEASPPILNFRRRL